MWERIKAYFKEQSKTEKKKLSEMTLKEKIEYIWEYYKLHIIGGILVIFVAGSIINGILHPPLPPYIGVGFYEIYLGEDFDAEFARAVSDALGVETERELEYPHFFISGEDPSAQMVIAQKLMAMLSTNELDLLITDNEAFYGFAYESYFMPLSEIGAAAPEEQLVYCESAETPGELAYGIRLTESALLDSLGIRGDALTIGVIINTARKTNALDVINLLLEK